MLFTVHAAPLCRAACHVYILRYDTRHVERRIDTVGDLLLHLKQGWGQVAQHPQLVLVLWTLTPGPGNPRNCNAAQHGRPLRYSTLGSSPAAVLTGKHRQAPCGTSAVRHPAQRLLTCTLLCKAPFPRQSATHSSAGCQLRSVTSTAGAACRASGSLAHARAVSPTPHMSTFVCMRSAACSKVGAAGCARVPLAGRT